MARRFSPPKQPPLTRDSSTLPIPSFANRSSNELGPPPGSEFVSPGSPLPSSDEAKNTDRPRRHLPILPPELVAEILAWLPVRPLVRFRCVSRSVKTLISSDAFIKSHLRNTKASSAAKPNRVERLIVKSEKLGLISYSLGSLHNYRGTQAEIDLARPERFPVTTFVRLLGPCDGLLCARVGGGFVVWNPSHEASTELPMFRSGPWIPGSFMCFGFGYDGRLDDYKVVVLVSSKKCDDSSAYQTEVQVCGLKSRVWRRIEDFKGVPGDDVGKVAAGCLHWKASYVNDEPRYTIMSLDLASETYREVMPPEFGEATGLWTLEALDDRLFVMSRNSIDCSSALWMMKEHGVADSWTKLFRVLHHGMYPGEWRPLMYISNSGEVIFRTRYCLLIYDIKENTVRFLTSKDWFDYDSYVYMETLVSSGLEN
ncbi:unnamed protein product [Linum tenue]|uniref:F-box domain-containing protein n=1 Tax=Linum tenue TaxID=586396 RepID=A0AAV0PDP5_9ROSI|nr:unnamed protein product [Linum tenue]